MIHGEDRGGGRLETYRRKREREEVRKVIGERRGHRGQEEG